MVENALLVEDTDVAGKSRIAKIGIVSKASSWSIAEYETHYVGTLNAWRFRAVFFYDAKRVFWSLERSSGYWRRGVGTAMNAFCGEGALERCETPSDLTRQSYLLPKGWIIFAFYYASCGVLMSCQSIMGWTFAVLMIHLSDSMNWRMQTLQVVNWSSKVCNDTTSGARFFGWHRKCLP